MSARIRRRVEVAGVVQGVGFRPFTYALARRCGLSGSVANTGGGVLIEVEGTASAVAEFLDGLRAQAPPLARIEQVTVRELDCVGGTEFVIGASRGGAGRTLVSPDVGMCADCLTELVDPTDRHYRHPFVSCTNCGPRFTVITGLPYDRPATTMAALPLCATCAAEYAEPANRRFHAQTVACPDCGPTLRLHRPGTADLVGAAASAEARALLAAGAVVAVKGLGGYHLAVDAGNELAVRTLRKRKNRGDKPFALMVPDLAGAAALARIGPGEQALLEDPRRPVVLLDRLPNVAGVAASVAPDAPDLGVVVAYTPLHRLLFGLPGDPSGPTVLVMTSGNRSGEPIVTDDARARSRLSELADAWLWHDRPIAVPCDDSVVRLVAGAELPIRRSRGWAPLPLALPLPVVPALAVGGEEKNTFALGEGGHAWLSAHVGDMADVATLQAFSAATAHLESLVGVRPRRVIADAHPGYRSRDWAERSGLPVRLVQHHHAHVAAAMAENGHPGTPPVIGVAFDGTGYGSDGAVWGGEVLLADYDTFTRAAHLRYVWLPGGDAAVRNPCRMALSHLHAADVPWDPALPAVAACTPDERRLMASQMRRGTGCGATSSMGRLFDAVSSLAGVCHRIDYEAEAAMRFEGLARDAAADCGPGYRFPAPAGSPPWPIDAGPVVRAAAADVLAGVPAAVVAARFHFAVAELVVAVAVALRGTCGLDEVALSGGVFLNALLTTLCAQRLAAADFRVLRHRLVPPSDAGLALGQLIIAGRDETEE